MPTDPARGARARCRCEHEASCHSGGKSWPLGWCVHCNCEALTPLAETEPAGVPIRPIVERFLPCICDEAYTSRNLTQPDCPRCNYADDLIDELEKRERARRVRP